MRLDANKNGLFLDGKPFRAMYVDNPESNDPSVYAVYKVGAARKWRVASYAHCRFDARNHLAKRLLAAGLGSDFGLDPKSDEVFMWSDEDMAKGGWAMSPLEF